MDVGVRELKAKLSTYLQSAAAGERITVTDRGRPIALLTPLPGRVDLAEATRAGWLSSANGEALPPIRRRARLRSTSAVLAEDRDE